MRASNEQDYENVKVIEQQEYLCKIIWAFLSGALLTLLIMTLSWSSLYAIKFNSQNETIVNSCSNLTCSLSNDSMSDQIEKVISFQDIRSVDQNSFCSLSDEQKFDCDPNPNTTQSQCLSLGCCWTGSNSSTHKSGVGKPSCYFPSNYVGYEITSSKNTATGLQLKLTRRVSSSFRDVPNLLVSIVEESVLTVVVMIYKEQGQEPLALPPRAIKPGQNRKKRSKSGYNYYSYSVNNGTLVILRTLNSNLIWSVNLQTLIYADQFIQIDTQVPVPALYGFGEHMDHFQKTNFNYTRYTFFNRDRLPVHKLNGYGTHPMYVIVEQDAQAHFTLLTNTYPSEAILRPGPAVTWRTIGGDLLFTLDLENSPQEAAAQYSILVGLPFFPPVWALGFHLSRYGYNNLNEMQATYERMKNAQIPYDTQWLDIDAMDSYNDFTYDPINFKGLPDFVRKLHNNSMYFVPILDPGLDGIYLNGTKYPGFNLDTIVLNEDGSPLRGQVWNHNWTAWIDFTSIEGQAFWTNQIVSFHDQIAFDGLWIDMNEPSNLVNGSLDGCSNSSSLNYPPYIPGDELNPIYERTICMNARHAVGSHYQVHNTYGHWEAFVTNSALQKLTKRPFLLSRSTFVGTGAYSAHWTGDIHSSWQFLKQSIVGILNFNLFGIPFVGADICGFVGNTTVELCARWHQLGAFYSFARNHNDKMNIDQDPPSLGPTVVQAAKNALQLRYQLHNVLYTYLYVASVSGYPVIWSLMMYAPDDIVARSIETQFMWFNQLMIIPVLEQGAIKVNAYFPAGIWYDFPSLKQLVNNVQTGSWLELDAPLDTIRLAVPGGSILVLQKPEVTIAETRKNCIEIVVFLDSNGEATSDLFWDNGETSIDAAYFNIINYAVQQNKFEALPMILASPDQPITSTLNVVGLKFKPQLVLLNEVSVPFDWKDDTLMVNVNQTYDKYYGVEWVF